MGYLMKVSCTDCGYNETAAAGRSRLGSNLTREVVREKITDKKIRRKVLHGMMLFKPFDHGHALYKSPSCNNIQPQYHVTFRFGNIKFRCEKCKTEMVIVTHVDKNLICPLCKGNNYSSRISGFFD